MARKTQACIDQNGFERSKHEADKDRRCIFCGKRGVLTVERAATSRASEPAVAEVLLRAARHIARARAAKTNDYAHAEMTEGARKKAEFDKHARAMQKILDSGVIDSRLDEELHGQIEESLRKALKDAEWLAREYPAPRRGRGAPRSQLRVFDQELRARGFSQADRRQLLAPDFLLDLWKRKERRRLPGDVGIEADSEWCGLHPSGCPRDDQALLAESDVLVLHEPAASATGHTRTRAPHRKGLRLLPKPR